jgi:hypothetical protein
MPDLIDELRSLSPELLGLALERDGAARLIEELPRRFSPQQVSFVGKEQRAWELIGLLHLTGPPPRPHEALAIFWCLYQHMLAAQDGGGRIHKGMPLCWIGDCFKLLGYPVHEKRYLLLTLCEDAI